MKEYRCREAVREWLADPENDLKELSEDFLKNYSKKVWMYRGPNNKQDPKYRETRFMWKNDEDTLRKQVWKLLDELWARVRQLLWGPTTEDTLSIQEMPSSTGTNSTISSTDAGEEAIAVDFINNVRVEIHNFQEMLGLASS